MCGPIVALVYSDGWWGRDVITAVCAVICCIHCLACARGPCKDVVTTVCATTGCFDCLACATG